MKILYHHRIRADDGQAVHVREMIGALRTLGHTVDECALVPKADGGGDRDRGDERRSGGVRAAFWRLLRLPRIAVESLEIAYDRQGTKRILGTVAERGRPDVIYERHALHCASGLRAARQLGVPLLLEVNSPMCDEMANLGLLRFGRRARRVEAELLRGADAVLAVSEVLAARLVELGAAPERVHVVRNGADPSRYPGARPLARPDLIAARQACGLPTDPDAFVLGFVGYVREWHRLDLAIDVLAMPGFERAHLVVVGDGPAVEGLRAHALARGVEGRLWLHGVVSGADLPRRVETFDASLIPAINPYASPLKAFDALAGGVPIVAPRQPNLAELFDDGVDGVLFEPGSAQALADAMRPLAESPGRAAELGAAGRRKLDDEGWTWQGQAERVLAIAARSAGMPVPTSRSCANLPDGSG